MTKGKRSDWSYEKAAKATRQAMNIYGKGDAMPETEGEERRLADFTEPYDGPTSLHITDILGEEVTVKGGTFRMGKHGEYALIHITRANEEAAEVITGGMVVIEALKKAAAMKAFPLRATFRMAGKTYVIE